MPVIDSRAGVQTVQKFGPRKAAVPMVFERGCDDVLRIAMLGSALATPAILIRDTVLSGAIRFTSRFIECVMPVNDAMLLLILAVPDESFHCA